MLKAEYGQCKQVTRLGDHKVTAKEERRRNGSKVQRVAAGKRKIRENVGGKKRQEMGVEQRGDQRRGEGRY